MPKQVALWERTFGRGKSQRIRQVPNVYAIVDDIDYPAVDQHLWHVRWTTRADGQQAVERVAATINGRRVLLHQFILALQGIAKPRHPLTIDHKDRNPLNNTRENLRIATRMEQRTNQGKSAANRSGNRPTSSYIGVSWSRDRQKWRAVAHLASQQHYLGSFDSEHKAAMTVNAFYMAHLPTTPLPNPTAATGMSDPTPQCRCRLCRPTRVLV